VNEDDPLRVLRRRVDEFAAHAAVTADMQCGAGCAGCCRVSLTVCTLEAEAIQARLEELPRASREAIASRVDAAEVVSAERCVMLDDDDRCAIYEARPLVCRSQGMPLAYPEGVLPVAAVLAKGARDDGPDRELTWCPLNFRSRPPEARHVFDAGRVDQVLAQLNRQHCATTGEDPLARISLRSLAASPPPAGSD